MVYERIREYLKRAEIKQVVACGAPWPVRRITVADPLWQTKADS